MAVIKFFIKLVAKILVLPLILFLNFILLVYNTVERIVLFLAGILNIILVVGVFCAYLNTGTWDLAKQSLIFFAIESVLIGLPQLCGGMVMCLQERLVKFMVA
jgi:hypothetical protein